jgi:hypothetical protein
MIAQSIMMAAYILNNQGARFLWPKYQVSVHLYLLYPFSFMYGAFHLEKDKPDAMTPIIIHILQD